jgi:hypothetical protein
MKSCLDAKDAGTEAEVMALNDPACTRGTVITRHLDEGWFAGEVVCTY